jgi:uncharacterized phage infection (PIP) family protein YhgE
VCSSDLSKVTKAVESYANEISNQVNTKVDMRLNAIDPDKINKNVQDVREFHQEIETKFADSMTEVRDTLASNKELSIEMSNRLEQSESQVKSLEDQVLKLTNMNQDLEQQNKDLNTNIKMFVEIFVSEDPEKEELLKEFLAGL